MKNAYHQIPLHPDDKKLTAFETNGKLLQFKRIPFGLTNAVGAFQRAVTQIIKEDGLVDIYYYLDDVTVAGNTIEELRDRSMKFESAPKKRKMALNEDTKELKQVRGLFAYYAKWIANFSTKIRPLIDTEIFSLPNCA